MIKTPYIFICLIFISIGSVLGQSTQNPVKVGFMGRSLDATTKTGALDFLEDQAFSVLDVSDDELDFGEISEQNLTHLWIYQIGQNDENWKRKSVARAIKRFVETGGNLILSMEAVTLLNDWGIEKNSYEIRMDTVKDEGFGRPLGFHAFKSHPLFEGMHGGAYTWKAKKDHIVKKIGFFDNNLPETSIAKVIGTEWTYITFHENNKLVMEYSLGKGKIIAVGAYTYFGRPNYNVDELHKFYSNIFSYTLDTSFGSAPINFWNYDELSVEPLQGLSFPDESLSIKSKRIALPEASIQMVNEKANDAPTIMAGRRMMMIGKQKGGIEEIWTHPFMSFRDIRTGLVMKNNDTLWLDESTPKIKVSPEMLVREYQFNNTKLQEVTTVSMKQPLGAIHYQWDGGAIDKLFVQYTTNFRYMWPYSHRVSGEMGFIWDPKSRMAITTAQSGDLTGILSFSAPPQIGVLGKYGGFMSKKGEVKGLETDRHQISGYFSFDADSLNGNIDINFYAGDHGLNSTLTEFAKERKSFESLVLETSDYYKDFMETKLHIHTPDSIFNKGYQWALLRTDQFFQETPQIGTSMVAGLGSTARGWDGAQEVSGRPGYSWYFGRDAQWCAFAVNAYGGHTEVKKILDVFEKFQALNGKILHELTTSGAVHYDASDATPLYVALAAHYLKYTGDVEFIRQKWPSIKKAMEFCYSTDTDGDGLIEITNVGHGWVEGGALFGTHTEVYLAGSWAAALESASYMAEILGKSDEAWFYKKDATRVKNKIDHSFWDKEDEFFYVGLEKDGSFRKEESVLTAVPIYFDAVLDKEKAVKSAARYASNEYSTDWGVRILPNSSKSYNPRSYHSGMVWPLFGGWASLAEYKTGHYTSAYSHIMNNLLVYDDWGLGSIEETLNGDHYEPAGVCSQQGWSQTMVLQPIYEGMLGIRPDVVSNTLELAPRLPWHWGYTKVENIPFGKNKIAMSMSKEKGQTHFRFKSGQKDDISIHFRPAFPIGTDINHVLIDGKRVNFALTEDTESVNLVLDFVLKGNAKISVQHNGGIGALPKVMNPAPGSENIGTKIVGQQLLPDGTFQVTLEGQPNTSFTMSLFSVNDIHTIDQGVIKSNKGDVYTVSGTLPSNGSPYAVQTISIKTH